MGDLRPIGSERLQGDEKLSRILEIATYGRTPENKKEYTSADYSIQLADGNYYGIVKEKLGYIVKKGINESEFDYLDPIKNRKYHKSFSQAMKKINLLAGELNRIYEHSENIPLIGEQKKFVLKTPETEKPAPPPPAPTEPSGEEELDLDLDLGTDTTSGGEELDLDLDLGDDTSGEEGLGLDDTMGDDGGVDGLKIIQKLTGKLGQKLRMMDQRVGLGSEDIKYVLNSIISAVDLAKLTEEDREDVLSKFESDDIIDYGVDDEADLDIELGGDDLDLDMEMGGEDTVDSEMSEQDDRYLGIGDHGFYDTYDTKYEGDFDFDFDEEEYTDFDEFMAKHGENQAWFSKHDGKKFWDIYRERHNGEPYKLRKRRHNGEMSEQGMTKIVDEIFAESKVDKVLNRYFKESKTEKAINEERKTKSFLNHKIKNANIKKEIKKLSETIEQEISAEKLVSETKGIVFLGKTNLKNLLFESDGIKYKVTTDGNII